MKTNTKYQYSAARCGAGKTHAALQQMALTPGRYLLVVDRLEVMPERVATLKRMAQGAGRSPHIERITSQFPEAAAGPQVGAVRMRIEALPRIYTEGHVVVIVTHEGFLSADLSQFRGWTAIIDETPTIFHVGTLRTPASADWLDAHYNLEPVGDIYATVAAAPGAPSNAAVMQDDLHAPLLVFHRRVMSPTNHVSVNLQDWRQVEHARCEWTWHSLWLPDELEAFDRVLILGNNFDRSLTYRIWQQRCPDIDWEAVPIRSDRTFARRDVVIRYFAQAHRASRSWFGEPEGRDAVVQMAEWIAENVTTDHHIWTANHTEVRGLRSILPGTYLTPQQAGSNAHAHCREASIIYTAKPSSVEGSIMRSLGVEPEAIQQSRELETILQFATRTSIRDPQSTETVTLHVYDRQQAEFLADYFRACGYIDTRLQLIDLGFAHDQRTPGQSGRPRLNLTPEEAARKAEEERRRKAERMRAVRAAKALAEVGHVRKRGRPRKAA